MTQVNLLFKIDHYPASAPLHVLAAVYYDSRHKDRLFLSIDLYS